MGASMSAKPAGEKREVAVPDRELLHVLFEHAGDALYALDRDRYRYLAVNPAFAALTGYPVEEMLASDFDPTQLADPDDRPSIRALDRQGQPDEGRIEFRLLSRQGGCQLVELNYRNFEVGGVRIRVGSIRPVAHRDTPESKLQAQVRKERQTKEILVEKNILLYELTERIRRVPILTTALLKADGEEAVYQIAGEHLTDPEGMNFAVAAFYAREGGMLALKHATMANWEEHIDPHKFPGLPEVLDGSETIHEGPPGNYFLPLKAHEDTFGVLQAFLYRRQRDVLALNPGALSGLRDVLSTVADTIGLILESLRLMAHIRRQSIVDQLTGVFNRRYLDKKVEDEVRRTRRYGRSMSLLIVDIDKFKDVNDTAGHIQGDLIIKGVARLLQEHTRDVDVICRYGGDEFVVIFPETPRDQAALKAEMLRQIVEKTAFPRVDGDEGGPINVSVSVGVAALDGPGSPQDLFRKADEALYRAKRSGRNVVCTA